MPACNVDEDLNKIPVLNEVEIAPDGDVWVGGECGRLWQLIRPTMDRAQEPDRRAHLRHVDPAADTGFLACQRANRSGWSIVRFTP
jgi:hypothetical protein